MLEQEPQIAVPQGNPPRVLLITPHGSYRIEPYRMAARRLGIQAVVATEGDWAVAGLKEAGIRIDLRDPEGSLRTLSEAAERHPFSGIVATDDASTELAARASEILGLPYNPVAAARISRRKDLARRCLQDHGVAVPSYWSIRLDRPLGPQMAEITYPCVLKPVALSASRGVIRADGPEQFRAAVARIARILEGVSVREEDERQILLVEGFIPGVEVAVEGILRTGELEVLAIFDKPDPLEGPFFGESYYTAPSRLSDQTQEEIRQRISQACAAYGLREGPIHGECRINAAGVWVLEVAARTIGGMCGQLFCFGTGYGLEEMVLAHAVGWHLKVPPFTGGGGVLMIPIPRTGLLRRVEGQEAAEQVPYIDKVEVQIREWQEVIPPPEGSRYLGYIFARAPSPEQAETALRTAHAQLDIVTRPLWKAKVVEPTPSPSKTPGKA